jgi:hypothetical protein
MTDSIRDPSQQWATRLERIQRYRRRSNPNGMTRPPRDPDEREFLRETGQEGPYVETPGDKPTGSQANGPSLKKR